MYAEKTNPRDPLLRRIFDAAKQHVRDNFDVFGRTIAEISDLKIY
jgi:hypothetical protein